MWRFFITITDYIRERVKISCEKLFKCFYGFDIEPYSIERTKILLALYALGVGEDIERLAPHLFVGDSLTKYWENLPEFQKKHGFDVIVGNPPYVSSSKLSMILVISYGVGQYPITERLIFTYLFSDSDRELGTCRNFGNYYS